MELLDQGAATPRTILPGIDYWSWFSHPHHYDFNGYLVRDPRGNICVDPVEPREAVLAELEREGVERIVLTNRNHVRAANRVRARAGARTAIHPEDASHARAQGAEIDDLLAIGESVGPFTIVGMPGKSPGEVALYCPARHVMIVGDAIVGDPPGQLKLLPEDKIDDLGQLRESIRGLFRLNIEALLLGDGVPVLDDVKGKLKELVATFPE